MPLFGKATTSTTPDVGFGAAQPQQSPSSTLLASALLTALREDAQPSVIQQVLEADPSIVKIGISLLWIFQETSLIK